MTGVSQVQSLNGGSEEVKKSKPTKCTSKIGYLQQLVLYRAQRPLPLGIGTRKLGRWRASSMLTVDRRKIAGCGCVSRENTASLRALAGDCALHDGAFATLEPTGVIRSVRWRGHVMLDSHYFACLASRRRRMRAVKRREGGCIEYSGGQCEVAVTNEDVAWSKTLRMMVLAEEVRCERRSRKKKEWLEVGRETLESPRRPGSVNNDH
jgi:hypothetical protein